MAQIIINHSLALGMVLFIFEPQTLLELLRLNITLL
jgi:hypothetical protein